MHTVDPYEMKYEHFGLRVNQGKVLREGVKEIEAIHGP
jgi:hypothetical protein